MAQVAYKPKKGEKIERAKGAVLPKEDTQVQYLKDLAGRKRGDIVTVHRVMADKLVEHKKVRLYTEDLEPLAELDTTPNVDGKDAPVTDPAKEAKKDDGKNQSKEPGK